MTSLVIGGRRLLGHSLFDASIAERSGLRLRTLYLYWPPDDAGGLLQQVLWDSVFVGHLGHLHEQIRSTVRSLRCGVSL